MLHVKLIEPPCTERYARWCERSKIPHQEEFSPTRLYKTVIRKVYRKIKSAYELYEEKEKMLQKALEQIDRYPEWRQQSIDIRSELSESIRKLENKIDRMNGSIGDLKKSSSEGKIGRAHV